MSRCSAIVRATASRAEGQRAVACHRPPAEPPRERKHPHPPQLAPGPGAAPDVAPELVAEPRRAREQRRDRRRDGGRPRIEIEQARPPVHGERPQREQQVQRPLERRGAERDGGVGRQDVREALIVVKAGGPERQVRIPAVERHVAVADPGLGPADHRGVDRRVVQVLDRGGLGPEDPQIEEHGEDHDRQRRLPRTEDPLPGRRPLPGLVCTPVPGGRLERGGAVSAFAHEHASPVASLTGDGPSV